MFCTFVFIFIFIVFFFFFSSDFPIIREMLGIYEAVELQCACVVCATRKFLLCGSVVRLA